MTFQRWVRVAALCAGLTAGACGCNNARMVTWDGPSGTGVVAIPHNDNAWPDKNREHAEAIMKEKCPHGYTIIDEREAVVGETVEHSVQRVGYLRVRETSVHPDKEYRIVFRSADAAAPVVVAPPPSAVMPARAVVPVAPPPAGVVTPPTPAGLPPAPIPVRQ